MFKSQSVVKECKQSSGKLPPSGLSQTSAVGIIDLSDMNLYAYYGYKATNLTIVRNSWAELITVQQLERNLPMKSGHTKCLK